jgi:cytosine/adenosine deaminase-related metal-dependent hydrolase
VVGARPRSPSGTCWKATLRGARLLGWDDQIGSIEPCKQAELAVWRLSGLAHADIVDPLAALVLGDRPPLDQLSVADRPVAMPTGC